MDSCRRAHLPKILALFELRGERRYIYFHVGDPHLLLPALFGGKRRIEAVEGS
jgi:hypothetical protein